MTFKKGDRIISIYLNSQKKIMSTSIEKHGVFISEVKHSIRYNGRKLAKVLFDGNFCTSKVPIYGIRSEEEQNADE